MRAFSRRSSSRRTSTTPTWGSCARPSSGSPRTSTLRRTCRRPCRSRRSSSFESASLTSVRSSTRTAACLHSSPLCVNLPLSLCVDRALTAAELRLSELSHRPRSSTERSGMTRPLCDLRSTLSRTTSRCVLSFVSSSLSQRHLTLFPGLLVNLPRSSSHLRPALDPRPTPGSSRTRTTKRTRSTSLSRGGCASGVGAPAARIFPRAEKDACSLSRLSVQGRRREAASSSSRGPHRELHDREPVALA